MSNSEKLPLTTATRTQIVHINLNDVIRRFGIDAVEWQGMDREARKNYVSRYASALDEEEWDAPILEIQLFDEEVQT